MDKPIIDIKVSDYQLIKIGIDLVHKVFGLIDCHPELENDPHIIKAQECANKWNEIFFDHIAVKKSRISKTSQRNG